MDPLSVTASVITVVQAAEAVISICCNYRSSIKDASWELSRMIEETRALRSVLRLLEEVADKAETPGAPEQSRLPALRLMCDPDRGLLRMCYLELERLRNKLAPPGWSGPAGSKRRSLVEALSWPLKKGDTEKILRGLERLKNSINVAITADQISSIIAIEDATQDLQVSMSSLEKDTYERNVRDWLRATDPTPKFSAIMEDRQPGTGAWLSDHGPFDSWKKHHNSFLWLYGIPGCGKTVLCSTAIENVLKERDVAKKNEIGVGYFYFDFNNHDQQHCDIMLRSLISQLWLQSREDTNTLDALYLACGSGASQPSSTMLKNTLKELVQNFMDTFIILDALDECRERKKLMRCIEEMAVWQNPSQHMLVTSRIESDIEESLSKITYNKYQICLQSAQVDDDIRLYVQSRIQTDDQLRKWQESGMQTEIETNLMEKADGMFQWVKCQLDALGRCLSPSDLREALWSLPRGLDNTYDRILRNIDRDVNGKRVAVIMQWLAYSRRPMSLMEISEVLTVDLEDETAFDIERRLVEPYDLLVICSSLVTIVYEPITEHMLRASEDAKKEGWLQLAHFSVREYLESSRLLDDQTKTFAIERVRADTFIAESCIIYLHQFSQFSIQEKSAIESEVSKEYPLAVYAAENWGYHAERAEETGNIIPLCKTLFLREYAALPIWVRITGTLYGTDAQGKFSPLLYISQFYLPKVMRALILEGADVNARSKGDRTIRAYSLTLGNPDIEVVQLSLDDGGADVDMRNPRGSTALMLAAADNKLHVVQALIDNGADIDAHNQVGSTALIISTSESDLAIVQLLLDRGASISSPYGLQALRTAALTPRYDVLRMLLARGADTNAEMHHPMAMRRFHQVREISKSVFPTVFLQTLEFRKYDVAELLLEYGADINAHSTVEGLRGVALEHALNHGSAEMVNFLLQHGANASLIRPEILNKDRVMLVKKVSSDSNIPTRGLPVVAVEVEVEESQTDA